MKYLIIFFVVTMAIDLASKAFTNEEKASQEHSHHKHPSTEQPHTDEYGGDYSYYNPTEEESSGNAPRSGVIINDKS